MFVWLSKNLQMYVWNHMLLCFMPVHVSNYGCLAYAAQKPRHRTYITYEYGIVYTDLDTSNPVMCNHMCWLLARISRAAPVFHVKTCVSNPCTDRAAQMSL